MNSGSIICNPAVMSAKKPCEIGTQIIATLAFAQPPLGQRTSLFRQFGFVGRRVAVVKATQPVILEKPAKTMT
jgi:hypothetical protein